jgi:hypothetical protein
MEKPAFAKACLSDVRGACGVVSMSGGDEMNSSTQVLAVRCAWVPVAMLCHARH